MVLEQYMKLEMTDMPVPETGANDVLVRVRACGICGSDVHGMDGSTGRRIPPIVMGHEGSGEVAATGTSVREFREGDRVTFDSTIYCGRCYYCGRGDWNLCDNREVLGVSPGEYRRHGAFAEYVAVPSHIVYKLPDSFRFEHAAVIEAVSVAVHAVRITPVQLGDTAVVVGSGMIGLLAIQALRSAGCATVIAIDVDDLKRDARTQRRRRGRVRGRSRPDTRARRGRCHRVRGRAGPDPDGDRERAKGGRSDPGGKCFAIGRLAAAGGGEQADPLAGVVRVER